MQSCDHVQKFRLTRKGHLCAFAWIQGNAARWRAEFAHIFKIVFDVRNCVWTPRLGNDGKNIKNQIFFENLNGRLALEDGSDRRETLGKRVSDDLEHFIFRHRKKKLTKKFKNLCRSIFVFKKLAFWRS